MKIGKLEKKFVNSKKQAEKNIKIAEQLFSQIDLSNVEKVLEVGCGIGVAASYLAKEHKWNVTGIDLDPEPIFNSFTHYNYDISLKFKGVR